jgi:hypothetical protein
MIFKTLASSALLFSAAACVTPPSVKPDGMNVALGQTAYVDGPKYARSKSWKTAAAR